MTSTKKLSIGSGVLVTIIGAIILLQLGVEVQMSVEPTRTQLFYNETGKFQLLAREYSELFNGTRKLTPTSITISTHDTPESINIIREYRYANGAVLRDHYFFHGDVDDLRLFPLSRTTELFNATNLRYQYKATNLKGVPATTYTDQRVITFGRVKFYLDNIVNSVKVTKSGTLTAKWIVMSDYERVHIRMVDPDPADTLLWTCNFNNGSVCGINGGGFTQANISGDGVLNFTGAYQTFTIPFNHSNYSYIMVSLDAYMNSTNNAKIFLNENASTTSNVRFLIDVSGGQQQFRPEPGYSPSASLAYGRNTWNLSHNKTAQRYNLSLASGGWTYTASGEGNGSFIRFQTGENSGAHHTYFYLSNISIFVLAAEAPSPTDTTPPIITSVLTSGITNQSATVTWQTDESANRSVKWGTSAASMPNVNSSHTLATSHSIGLTGLSANTTYFYNVTSCDSSSNCNMTGPYNFTTQLAGGGGALQLVACYTFLGDAQGWTGHTASNHIEGWIGHETASASLINSPNLSLSQLGRYYFEVTLQPRRTHNSKFYLNSRRLNTDDAHFYFEDNNATGSGPATHVLKYYSAGSGFQSVRDHIPHNTLVTITADVDLVSGFANGTVSHTGNATITSWGAYTVTTNGDYVTYLEGQNESSYNKVWSFCYYTFGVEGAPSPHGTLNLTNKAPGHLNATQFGFFNYTTEIRCDGSSNVTCGNVTAYLDPLPGLTPSTTGFNGKTLGQNYEDYINGILRYGQVRLANLTSGAQVMTVPWFGVSPWWGDYCHAGNLKTGCGATGTFSDYCQVTDEHSQAALMLSMTRNVTVANTYFPALLNSIRVMNATNTTNAVCGAGGCNWGYNTKWRWRVTCSGTPQTCTMTPTQDTAPDADARYIVALYNIYNNPVYENTTVKNAAYAHVTQMCKDFRQYAFVAAEGKSRVNSSNIIRYWPAVSASITKNGGPARGYDSFAFPGYWGDFATAMLACGANTANTTEQTSFFAYANDSIEAFLSAAEWTMTSNAPKQPDGRQGKWTNITTGTSADTPQYVCQSACVGGNDDADGVRWVKMCLAHGLAQQNGLAINPHLDKFCSDVANASAHQSTACPVQWSTAGTALSSVGLGYKQNGLCSYVDFSSEQANWLTRMVTTGTQRWSSSNTWYNDNPGRVDGTPCFGIYWGEFIVSGHGYGIGYADSTFNFTIGAGGNASSVCGNGIIEVGETCDDGNTLSGDGCSSTCQIEIDPKGLVSTVVGATPFYTNRSNPQTGANVSCLYNMVGGSACNVTWFVNATGLAGTSWSFFAYANSTVNATIVREPTTQNVSIEDKTPPVISNITVSSLTSSSAVISWTTNEFANGSLRFNTSASPLGNLRTAGTSGLWRQIPITGLVANTTYHYNLTSCDVNTLGAANCATVGPYTFKTLENATFVTLNISGTLNVEMGTVVSINASAAPGTSFCVDVNHPEYGTNYVCSNGSIVLNVSAEYFRKTQFNDTTTAKNLTFNSAGNQTVFVRVHKFDEMVNLSLNLTGYENFGLFPNNVRVFVGQNLSNTIGLLLNTTEGFVGSFSDASTTKNVSFSTPETKIAGYLYLPKQATVNNATMVLSFDGTESYLYQHTPNSVAFVETQGGNVTWFAINYTKPAGVRNGSKWEVSRGANLVGQVPLTNTSNFTISQSCFEHSDTVQLRYITRVESGSYSVSQARWINALWNYSLECFNGSWVHLSGRSGGSARGVDGSRAACFHDPPHQSWLGTQYAAQSFDNDVNTYGFYSPLVQTAGWCGRKELYGTNVYPSGIGLLFEEGMYWSLEPNNPFMEAGFLNGTRDWSYVGYFNTTTTSNNFAGKLNTFLDACTPDSQGYCLAPIYVYSEGGTFTLSNISVNFSYLVNPVEVSVPLIEAYQRANTSAWIDVPLTFSSSQTGIIQIDGLAIDYRGGNSSVNVTAHNDDYTVTASATLLQHYTRWNYSFPPTVQYFEFVPPSPTSKRVSPYGQTTTRPFFNITNLGYSSPRLNFSVYVNESYSCVNLSWGATNNYSQSVQANNTWREVISNVSYLGNFGVWVWADYGCNTTSWRLWEPDVALRACGNGTLCDEAR